MAPGKKGTGCSSPPPTLANMLLAAASAIAATRAVTSEPSKGNKKGIKRALSQQGARAAAKPPQSQGGDRQTPAAAKADHQKVLSISSPSKLKSLTSGELLQSARKGVLGGLVPASRLSLPTQADGPRVQGRPARARLPVLETWRNERVVWERKQGSAAPSIAAIELPKSAQSIDVKATSQSGLAIRVKSKVSEDTTGRKKQRTKMAEIEDSKVLKPLPKQAICKGVPRKSNRHQSTSAVTGEEQSTSAAPQPELLEGQCLHCGRGPSTEITLCLPNKAADMASKENDTTEDLKLESALPHRTLPVPQNSCLRRRATSSLEVPWGSATRSSSKVCFDDAKTVQSEVADCRHHGQELWYEGFAVECDECDAPVEWGQEGSLAGAPGRSRFAQMQVLCNRCLSNNLYGQVGSWLLLGVAAGAQGVEVLGPVETILDQLLLLGKPGPVNDLLIGMLGVEAEYDGARENVLIKVRDRLPQLLSALAGLVQRQEEESEPGPSCSSVPVGAKGATTAPQ